MPQRTPWGDPDLRGAYPSDNSIGVPLERPERFGERAGLTDEEYSARVDYGLANMLSAARAEERAAAR